MPLNDVAASGDQLKTLYELRNVLANAIASTRSARDIATLTARLVDVLDRIADLEPLATQTPLAEFTRRRAERVPQAPRRTNHFHTKEK